MRRLILTAVLAVLAAPALAQEAAASPATPETTTALAKSAEELAIEASARDFSDAMVRMQNELVKTTTPEEADAVVAGYQPMAEALADRMNAFLTAHANQPENQATRQDLLAQASAATARVRGLPQFIRLAVEQAIERGNAQAAAAAEAAADADETVEQAPPATNEPAQPEPAPADPSA